MLVWLTTVNRMDYVYNEDTITASLHARLRTTDAFLITKVIYLVLCYSTSQIRYRLSSALLLTESYSTVDLKTITPAEVCPRVCWTFSDVFPQASIYLHTWASPFQLPFSLATEAVDKVKFIRWYLPGRWKLQQLHYRQLKIVSAPRCRTPRRIDHTGMAVF